MSDLKHEIERRRTFAIPTLMQVKQHLPKDSFYMVVLYKPLVLLKERLPLSTQ